MDLLKKCIILFLYLLSTEDAFPQSKRKHLIITFKDSYSNGFHGPQYYFWTIPIDSINSYQNAIYPLYISSFTKSHFENCCSNVDIAPSIPTLKPNDYDFDSTWFASHDNLLQLINKKKKLIQTITIKKHSGSIETISIYATPIIGEFCGCNLIFSEQKRYNYSGNIYLTGNFSQDFSEFWKLDVANFILKREFININFKKMAYPGN